MREAALGPRPLITLKKRREFLAARGGPRAATPSFVVETKPRDGDPSGPARFGFTVTKQIGTAVVRNRVRRRLRALVRALPEHAVRSGHDYVLIARAGAFDRPFAELAKDLEQAMRRVHDRPRGPRRTPSPEKNP